MTLAEAKAHSRVDIPDDDALIASLILAAREWVEGQTHRALLTQTWDCKYDEWTMEDGNYVLRLPLAPLQSVTSVTYIDGDGVSQTLSSTLYQVVASTEHPRVVQAYGATWPTLRGQPESVTVRGVFGYTQAPQTLRLAIKLLVGHWYDHREAAAMGAPVEVPLTIEALISPHRRATV